MSLHTAADDDALHPTQPAPTIAIAAESPRLVVDLKRSGANTPAELSPGSVNSDPDDGCDKYSCRSGESEVTATVHDDVPDTSIHQPPSHSIFSNGAAEHHITNRPSITASINTGPDATITTAATTALPPNKKPNLLNTYMRRLFDHYKVNFIDYILITSKISTKQKSSHLITAYFNIVLVVCDEIDNCYKLTENKQIFLGLPFATISPSTSHARISSLAL